MILYGNIKVVMLARLKYIFLLCCITFYGNAHASSDKSWDELFFSINNKCNSTAGLTVTGHSKPVLFPDETGVVGLLMKGHYTSTVEPVQLLCIYVKKTGQAYVNEYRW